MVEERFVSVLETENKKIDALRYIANELAKLNENIERIHEWYIKNPP